MGDMRQREYAKRPRGRGREGVDCEERDLSRFELVKMFFDGCSYGLVGEEGGTDARGDLEKIRE